MSSNDWLPAQIPFDLVRRGYAPEQVTAHLERLEYDLRIATANSDATNQRLSEVSAQLSAAHAEVDHLRGELDRVALQPVSMTGLSNRMQRMIRLAEEEATEIRARANSDAEQMRMQSAASAAATTADRDAFDTERETTRRQLAQQVREMLDDARAEATRLQTTAAQESSAALAAASAEADRLVREASAEAERLRTEARTETDQLRTSVSTEAEQVRSSAIAEAERVRTEANAEADSVLTTSRTAADELTRTTAAERMRLDAESAARRKQVEEDFEIAIASRRTEAHARLTEREEISVADAQQRVDSAAAESERLVAEASAQAVELVRRAAAQSHQRVAEADEAIRRLTVLRSDLLGQLDSLRAHLGQVDALAASAVPLLDAPAEEATRPVTDDFPEDPEGRPTAPPAAYDSGDPGPWDDVELERLRAEESLDDDSQTDTIPAVTDADLAAAAAADAPTRVDAADSDSPDTAEAAEAPSEQLEPADAEDVTLPHQSRGGFRAFAKRQ